MAATAPPPIYPQLIVGLGNPEPKYDGTRHNIGFAAIDALAKAWQTPLSDQKRFKGMLGEARIPNNSDSDKIYLLKPMTYMNRSGESIQSVLSWYKLAPENVLIIYDDMDLPLGRIRLRLSGSAGGHNGIKSTIACIGTQTFPRLRIGIGRPRHQTGESVSHVLGKFSPQEQPIVHDVLNLSIDALQLSLKRGVEMAMNRYNNRNVAPESNNQATDQTTNQAGDQVSNQPLKDSTKKSITNPSEIAEAGV